MLIRDVADGFEVFMLQRTHNAAFAGGMYVFPGGKVDATDGAQALEPFCDGLDDFDYLRSPRIVKVIHRRTKSCGGFGLEATTTFPQSCCERNLATPFARDTCQGWQMALSSPSIDPGANSAFLELLSNVPELQLIVFV
jgi:hypothetical protein